ncbi:cation diffusion facilitator family transporter [Conexibacter sp. DBS9H8]|uniref:cation diffusion facilitator family transporter n=1 Tax=Conexibacter sp. DBS9H8 TaxID=2937801 RepID=UPI00200F58CE|nr:cation diffusion facilitator family transporter [Conexibacter sp. DBS9H8]
MAHDHDHAAREHDGHGHGGHSHGVSADADRGKLAIALGLIVGFMLFEVVVGAVVHSLALLSDAAHMLTDAGAIALSLVAIRLAARPARGAMTFGLKRTEILSAQFNGATLLILGLLIIYEGITRLINPPNVGGSAVLIVALVGIVVNLAASYTLSKANRQSMNLQGAFQHILTDLAAFIFTAVAGAVILATGFRRADGIASLVIAAIMLHAAYGLLKASGRVFLEAAPEGLDPDTIGQRMIAQPGVREVHDLHVWEVTSGFPALSAHVLAAEHDDCHEVAHALKRLLHEEFHIAHTTLQVEHEHAELLRIETPEQQERPISAPPSTQISRATESSRPRIPTRRER